MTAEKRSKAGAYAWSKHMESLRPWFLPMLLILLMYPLFLFGLVFSGILGSVGTIVGSFAIAGTSWATIKLMESRDWRWEEGARGEFLVGEELEKLYKEGFHVFHDYYSVDRGNVDHFVVGPPGVFAIETKAWKGEIMVKDDKFQVDGRPRSKDPINQVRGEAKDVRRLIADACGATYWVNPIVCFSNGELRHYGPVRGVEVTDVGSLRNAIMRHPRRRSAGNVLSAAEVGAVSRYLQKHLGVIPASAPGSPPLSPGRLRCVMKSEWTYLALYALYLLILSTIFAGPTARVLEDSATAYRAFEQLWITLFSLVA